MLLKTVSTCYYESRIVILCIYLILCNVCALHNTTSVNFFISYEVKELLYVGNPNK